MDDNESQKPFVPIETGLMDAKIYQSGDLPITVLRPNINANQIAKLARHMIMDILTEDVVLRAAGLSQEQFEQFVKPTELYRRVYDTFFLEWHSPLSTNKRIAIMSAALLEDGLLDIADRMTDKREPLNHAIEAAKTLAKFAGIGEPTSQGSLAPGERFTINIITSKADQRLEIPQISKRQSTTSPILIEPRRQDEKE